MVCTAGGGVSFGRVPSQVTHAFRHCDATGLDRSRVRSAILADSRRPKLALRFGLNHGWVKTDGVWLHYVAYLFPDGAINVGRIIPFR
jgi:hypothetical protein